MRRIKKVHYLATAFVATTTLALGVAMLDTTPATLANAETNQTAITMMYGASVRLTDPNGLRFQMKVEKGEYNAENTYGMLIMPTDIYDYIAKVDYVSELNTLLGEGNYINLSTANTSTDKLVVYQPNTESDYFFSGAIVNMLPQNIAREFIGIGYEIEGGQYTYTTQSAELVEGVYEYSAISKEDNSRSISEVAALALEDTTKTYTTEQTAYLQDLASKSKAYTITWVNDNGDVLQSSRMTEGTMPVYNGETPTSAGKTFVGWDKEFVTATEDATYTAKYINAVATAYSGGSATSLVNDNGVMALKGGSVQSSANNGMTLTFPESITSVDILKYKVLVTIRAVNSTNGQIALYQKVNGADVSGGVPGLTTTYTDIDVSASAAKINVRYLTSWSVFSKAMSTIYVSDVKIVERTSGDTLTLLYTNQWNTKTQGLSKKGDIGTLAIGQAVPSGAPSGISYCVKYTDSTKKGGLTIDMGGLDVSKYASITIKFGTTGNYNIDLNGVYGTWGNQGKDLTVDIIPTCTTKTVTTLNSVTIGKTDSVSEVYLYSIEFVLK